LRSAPRARAFRDASPEDRARIVALLELALLDPAVWPSLQTALRPVLRETMDRISAQAQERGLTPEVLDSILDEAKRERRLTDNQSEEGRDPSS
jgi:hypothetical protein